MNNRERCAFVKSALAVLVFAGALTGAAASSPYEGELSPRDRDDPHPRRYWPIYRDILHPGGQVYDMGVYDPLKKTPQYDPRIPY